MDSLMRSALSSGSERGMKEQALLNLDEYLREEESRTLQRMADDACNALGNRTNVRGDGPSGLSSLPGTGGAISRARRKRRAKASAGGQDDDRFQTVNGEHDNSLANGVAQRYWDDVVGLCTDAEPSVRLKALHLSEVVLRQGLVHPMSCFPPLIALQADPVLNVRKLAQRLLRQQQHKYSDFFDNMLGSGLELMFTFYKRLESVAAARERKRRKDNTIQVPKKASADDVNNGFGHIYKLINNTRAGRFKFLHALLRRYEGTITKSDDIDYLCFLGKAVAALPFSTNDEPLFVVFHLNRIISLRASTLPDSLQRSLALLEENAGDVVPENSLRGAVYTSLAASVMLALKRHVKDVYELTDARTQAYNPAESLKPAEGFRNDRQGERLDLARVDPSAGATLAGCRRQTTWFCELMQDDTNDYAGELRVTAGRRGRPSRAAVPSAEANNDADGDGDGGGDSDSDGADDDDFEVGGVSTAGQKTAALPSTGAVEGSRRRGRGRRRNDEDDEPTPRKRLAL